MTIRNAAAWAMPLIALVATGTDTQAATLEGHSFDDVLRVAEQDIRLNGLGVRKVLFIRGYIAGIYLPQKATSYSRIASMPGPKRLYIKMLRAATASDFIDAMLGGIQQNSDAQELASIAPQIEQLKRAMQMSQAVAAGDTIQFDYLPSEGTLLSINGVVRSAAITGTTFYNAILKIFIGSHPVDNDLKQGLLGELKAL